jgi:dihydroorotase
MTPKIQNILIRNAHIVDPYNSFEGNSDVYISKGRIVFCSGFSQKSEFSSADSFTTDSFTADLEIDATGKFLLPSLVDTNVHLREPGFERKATIESELSAAVSAGIGHLACLPTCEPTIDTASLAKSIIDKANKLNLSKVYPIGALTKGLQGSQLSDMKSLADAHCVALTNFYEPIQDLSVLRRCYEYAATFDITVFIYPQMYELAKSGCAHEGFWSAKLGLPGIPESAETIAIATHLILIEQTGVSAHFSQLSSGKSVTQIAQAKSSGMKITADVAAHQLFLDDSCLESYDSHFHLCPPIRSINDKEALIAGLKSGVIDAICSSHQPHEEAAKKLPFQGSEIGISALETLMPLSGKLLEQGFSILEIAKLISENPANILGIQRKGILPGERADFCLIDPQANWQLNKNDLISQGKNSPFIGEQFSFRNCLTFVNGKLIFQKA